MSKGIDGNEGVRIMRDVRATTVVNDGVEDNDEGECNEMVRLV